MWEVLSSETLCKTPWLRVDREVVATPSRPNGVSWIVSHRPIAAVVAPRLPDGSFVLVRQERIPVRRETWEFPAGQVDGEASEEGILRTALRELGEETGYACSEALVPLGLLYSSVGFTTECCHLFLAPNVFLQPELVKHDENEAIGEVKAFRPEELRGEIAAGRIIDSNTLAIYARLVARELL